MLSGKRWLIILVVSLPIVLFNIELSPFRALSLTGFAFSQEESYTLRLSTMEIVDKNEDGRKDGLEVFYILKRGVQNIEFSQEAVTETEVYLYEDREGEVLMTFWQIGELKEFVLTPSNIYLPFRGGFAYNVYRDKIVPAVLKIKIAFKDGGEVEASLKERLSFLSY